MGVAMSTYYADPKRSRSEQEQQEADLRGKIEQIRIEFPRACYRMLLQHMKRAGIKIRERKSRGAYIVSSLTLMPYFLILRKSVFLGIFAWATVLLILP
jgi:hypothetical protein